MSWVSITAIVFVVWWITLFAMLPLGLRTQDEDDEVTLGTTPSAPRGPHMLKAVIRTTIVTAILMAGYFIATGYFGLAFDQIPRIVPDFGA